jgi:hypothetical protein
MIAWHAVHQWHLIQQVKILLHVAGVESVASQQSMESFVQCGFSDTRERTSESKWEVFMS